MTNSSINFGTLLLIAFIVLKLCNVITWSWWWVLCPIWIPVAVLLVLIVGYGILNIVNKILIAKE